MLAIRYKSHLFPSGAILLVLPILASVSAQGSIGQEADVALLVSEIEKGNEAQRKHALLTLSQLGKRAAPAVPILRAQLSKSLAAEREGRYTPETGERALVLYALQAIGDQAAPAIPEIVDAMQHGSDQDTPFIARETLRSIGSAALPYLVRDLESGDEERSEPTDGIAIGEIAGDLETSGDVKAIPGLKRALEALARVREQKTPRGKHLRHYEGAMGGHRLDVPIQRALRALEDRRKLQLVEATRHWLAQHSWVWKAPAPIVSFFVIWLGLLWMSPLTLLRINSVLQLPDIIQKIFAIAKLPLRSDFVQNAFIYRPRVLDAWVEKHIAIVRDSFLSKKTVAARQICVPVPVSIDGQSVPSPANTSFQPIFSKGRVYLLIHGEGGAGKTNLACQFGRWAMMDDPQERLGRCRMIPILLEEELDGTLVEAVRDQLYTMVGTGDPVFPELVERLLRLGRLLVIIDGLSERGEFTHKLLQPERADFPVSVLAVTSRRKEELGKVPLTEIQPLRITGNRLSEFVGAYLSLRGMRDKFDDPDFFRSCTHLSTLVGKRDVTVLLAKFYVDLMIAKKAGFAHISDPRNIPELMLEYLNYLNRNRAAGDPDDRTVQRDTKVLAWCCLQRTYRPDLGLLDQALERLRGDDPQKRVEYLHSGLGVIELVGPAQDRIRFVLDPLAEYLAAYYVVEDFGREARGLEGFLEKARAAPGGPALVRPFLMAVRDCCLAAAEDMRFPESVLARVSEYVEPVSNAPGAVGT